MGKIDPLHILKLHLEGIEMSQEEEDAIKTAFKRLAELAALAAQGEDVEEAMVQVEAQIALFKAGASIAAQTALYNAAKQYAATIGQFIGVVIKNAAGGIL